METNMEELNRKEPKRKKPKRQELNCPDGGPLLHPDPEDLGHVRKMVAVFLVEYDTVDLSSVDIARDIGENL